MPPHDEEEVCTCLTNLETLQLANDYAEKIACDFVDDFGGACKPMFKHVVQALIVRFAHLGVLSIDPNTMASERKSLDAVEQYILEMSKSAPALLKAIMDEAAQKENPNASH